MPSDKEPADSLFIPSALATETKADVRGEAKPSMVIQEPASGPLGSLIRWLV